MPTGSKDDMEMEPGAVGVAVKIETGIKYCPGMEITLPSYTFMETKAHSLRVGGAHTIDWNNGESVGTAHTPQL